MLNENFCSYDQLQCFKLIFLKGGKWHFKCRRMLMFQEYCRAWNREKINSQPSGSLYNTQHLYTR